MEGRPVRSNGGQLLSASALVALGTSVLLAALIGLGLSELRSAPPDGASGLARTEAAAVVVPAETVSRRAPSTRRRHKDTTTQARTPALTPSYAEPVVPRPTNTVVAGSSSAGAQSTTSPGATRAPTSAASPSPSPTPKRGHGKGNGHGKPAKR
jgi:hypothetical protein